jgi:transglutaminase-like putative cysteine protease
MLVPTPLYPKAAAVLTVSLLAAAPALALEYRMGAAPAWVEPVSVESALQRAEAKRGGEHALLSDTQIRFDGAGRQTFFHFASKPLDTRGVEEASNISTSFDPSYQTLTLHTLKVVRGGQAVDRLKSAKIRVLQRESKIEERTYDGRKTVNITLDDVRVGDVVEYSYTVTGANPVFENRAIGGLELQWSVPVDRLHARLLVPKSRNITVQPSPSARQPVVRDIGEFREYLFDQKNVPGLMVDRDAPEDFSPHANVQWNEFADWKAVATWAVPMYRTPTDAGADVRREIERIKAASADTKTRVAEALHFVQREIRYLGVQVGIGTHRPNTPALVLKRRFGDCKDKAVLLVALLQGLGIDAKPALVHTELASAVQRALPSPAAFNHVLVRAKVDGVTYWIDPTRSLQPSGLDHLHQPDYGYALVIDPAANALEKMTAKRNYEERVHAVYDSRAGVGQAVSYEVKTRLSGRLAENMRDRLAAQGQDEIESDYLNFYAKRYPAIKTAAPIEFKDDIQSNVIEVVERYSLPDFWTYSAEQKRQTGNIRSASLRTHLRQPDKLIRTSPMATEHPLDIEETTEVLLPESWKMNIEPTVIKDPAFEFSHTVSVTEEGKKITFRDRFRTVSDRVAPEKMAEYAKNLDKASDSVGRLLYKYDKKTPGEIGGGISGLAWLFIAAAVAFLWWAVSRLPSPGPAVITDKKANFTEETTV